MLCALIISACSTTHYVALSDDLTKRLDRCQRPDEVPPEWVTCTTESCRRARELPVHTSNAAKHHRCADIIDDVKAENANIRNQAQ